MQPGTPTSHPLGESHTPQPEAGAATLLSSTFLKCLLSSLQSPFSQLRVQDLPESSDLETILPSLTRVHRTLEGRVLEFCGFIP